MILKQLHETVKITDIERWQSEAQVIREMRHFRHLDREHMMFHGDPETGVSVLVPNGASGPARLNLTLHALLQVQRLTRLNKADLMEMVENHPGLAAQVLNTFWRDTTTAVKRANTMDREGKTRRNPYTNANLVTHAVRSYSAMTENAQAFLRPKGVERGVLTGIMSARYHPLLPIPSMVEGAMAVLLEKKDEWPISNIRIEGTLTDSGFSLYIHNANITAEVEVGKVMSSFVRITTSETGQGGEHWMSGQEILACLNMMTIIKQRRNHVGSGVEELAREGILSEKTLLMASQTRLAAMQDYIRNGFDPRRVQIVANAVRENLDAQVELEKAMNAVNAICIAEAYSKEMSNTIWNAFMNEKRGDGQTHNSTKDGLVQAFTAVESRVAREVSEKTAEEQNLGKPGRQMLFLPRDTFQDWVDDSTFKAQGMSNEQIQVEMAKRWNHLPQPDLEKVFA